MSAQKRVRLDTDGASSRRDDQDAAPEAGREREQLALVGADEGATGTSSASHEPRDDILSSPSSAYSKPGRGLPVELLVKIVAAPVKLERRDYFHWALASRVFLQPALDKVHEHAHIDIEESIVADKAAYLTPEDHVVWCRLIRPRVARATRSLKIQLIEKGWGGQQPDPTGDLGPEIEDPPGGLMLNEWADLQHLLASLVNLDELEVDWAHKAEHLEIDVCALPTVRSLTLSRSDPELVAAAPNLVRLSTPLYSFRPVPECPAPPLRELVITELPDGIMRASTPLEYLAWLTPSTLTSLDVVAKHVAASTLLPFLTANLARWPSFRTLRLVKAKGRSGAWSPASLAEVKALSEAHGFEVCECEDKASSSGAYGGYGDYGDDGGYGGYGEELYFPHGEMPGGDYWWTSRRAATRALERL